MRFHRAELQQALMARVGPVVSLNSRFSRYTEYENHVELEFTDGSIANCDLLIAADGIRSAIRKQFLQENVPGVSRGEKVVVEADPVWSGTYAFRGLLSHEAIEKAFPGHRAKTNPVIVSVFRVFSGRWKANLCHSIVGSIR